MFRIDDILKTAYVILVSIHESGLRKRNNYLFGKFIRILDEYAGLRHVQFTNCDRDTSRKKC